MKKATEGHYILNVECQGEEVIIEAPKLVLAGGRFLPHFLLNDGGVTQSEFQRLEYGVRVEGDSKLDMFNPTNLTDPKYILVTENGVEYRTFCWCRDGEVVRSDWFGIQTYSGRADIAPTGRSNFGFTLVF